MRFLKKKKHWLIAAALGAAAAYYWVYWAPLRSNQIKVTSYYENWYQVLNVHSSPTHKLRVGKHTFKSVIGDPPYYLDLPKIQAILFVQSPFRLGPQKVVLHYFNGSTITFNDPDSTFPGHDVGDKRLSVLSHSETEIICKDTVFDITYTFNIASRTLREQPSY